jgi:hypothetical protein
MHGAIPPLAHYAFMAWCSVTKRKHKDNFAFAFAFATMWKTFVHIRMYPKFSGLAVWIENCKWYSSLLLGAVVSLFCESV